PPPPPPPPPGGGGTVARLTGTPLAGTVPLVVRFDASASTGTEPLAVSWDFGDGANEDDAAAAILAARTAYLEARDTAEAGHYADAVEEYLADVALLLPLTAYAIPGPVTARDTNRIDRVAHWYLGKIAHNLGSIYIYHDLGLAPCDRYGTALQYQRESASQFVAGGWPGLPAINGVDEKIGIAIDKLEARDCPIPPPVPAFDVAAAPTGARTADHTYTRPGRYTARVRVDGPNGGATASVNVVVDGGAPPPPPPPGGPLQGFGAGTTGGAGGREIHVTAATDDAVRAAFKDAADGGAIVVFDVTDPIKLDGPLPTLTGANVTIEGNGATLVGTAITRTAPMIDVRAHDVIVRNLRLRSGGDNLRAQTERAYNVVFDHISSTGAGDDGISIAYGAHDVTVQWCFLAGNTRSIFLKYGTTTNVSVHHTWMMKQWIRGPLVSGAVKADLRNIIVEDWSGWATRFEADSSGNVVNSLFDLSRYGRSIGGSTNALRLIQTGPVFTAGNAFRGEAVQGAEGDADAPIDAPPVTTLPVGEMEGVVRANAGCLPRDAVDQAYIDAPDTWRTSKYVPFRINP
ncbi:MAG TPA: hypothetical protein VKA21_10825, partial [Candidatus Binatia bacterium]|nr:hypothetical protein [Candidatus Binatia bacterium]